MAQAHGRKVFIVSDGTGRTAEQVVRSAIVQFEEEPTEVLVRPGVRSVERVERVVREAAETGGVIFYTLVSDVTRKAMKNATGDHMVEAVDILGPVFGGLNTLFHRRAHPRPGRYYQSERVLFDRMDAIDYTLKHDDGIRLHELGQADIVLVGVSRVSKSSTCFFLAYRGIRAANVPLLPDRPPPPELARLAKNRVIGLTMTAKRLVAIRHTRLHSMGVRQLQGYAEGDTVEEEIRSVQRQMGAHGWRQIDVSYMAIEEIAQRVRGLMNESGMRRRPRSRQRE